MHNRGLLCEKLSQISEALGRGHDLEHEKI